jgi:hypothetical protein
MTIRASDLMPMFTATNLADTTRVDYQDVWQRKNLVLATLAEDDPTATAYAASLSVLTASLDSLDAALIVTTTRIAGIPTPGVVVADRWGEVYYVKSASRASELPGPDELMEWVQYVRNECPECQGEAR